jgi:hypothetical protein
MIYKIVAIRDRAGDVFAQPIFVTNLGGALRSFADEINRKAENNQLNTHPEDFDLFEIGSYNDETAAIESQMPRQLAVGKDLIRS